MGGRGGGCWEVKSRVIPVYVIQDVRLKKFMYDGH